HFLQGNDIGLHLFQDLGNALRSETPVGPDRAMDVVGRHGQGPGIRRTVGRQHGASHCTPESALAPNSFCRRIAAPTSSAATRTSTEIVPALGLRTASARLWANAMVNTM